MMINILSQLVSSAQESQHLCPFAHVQLWLLKMVNFSGARVVANPFSQFSLFAITYSDSLNPLIAFKQNLKQQISSTMKQVKKDAKKQFETFYRLFKDQRTKAPNGQQKEELLNEVMMKIDSLQSALDQEQQENAKLKQQLKESHQMCKRLEKKVEKIIEKYEEKISEANKNYSNLSKEYEKYKYAASHHDKPLFEVNKEMGETESSLIGHHPLNPHQQKYLIKYQNPNSAKIIFHGQPGFWYNFINKVPIKAEQIAKYSVTITKYPLSVMIGFCTEKSFGRQYNHNLDQSFYLYCSGKGVYENGVFKRVRMKVETYDTIVCIADLVSYKIIWAKNQKTLVEISIPQCMREKSLYFSLLQYIKDSEIELSL